MRQKVMRAGPSADVLGVGSQRTVAESPGALFRLVCASRPLLLLGLSSQRGEQAGF